MLVKVVMVLAVVVVVVQGVCQEGEWGVRKVLKMVGRCCGAGQAGGGVRDGGGDDVRWERCG